MDRKYYIITISGMAVCLGLGVIIGYFSAKPTDPHEADSRLSDTLRNEISNENIEEYLRFLTEEPHIGGRERDEVVLVEYIKEKWEDAGLEVVVHPYTILLSYPNDDDPNYVAMKYPNGTEYEISDPVEKILDPSQNKSGVVNPFNAYSAYGDATGDIVYVNYARIEDFQFIVDETNINLTGAICMARYGKIFRGNKANFSEEFGCAALILYSDPADYAVVGEPVYPDTWYLPETGAQRGNTIPVKGDPLSLHYPSIETAFRDPDDRNPMPSIPVTPIGYGIAKNYLNKMAGVVAPEDWQGGLDFPYKLGPGFAGDHANSDMFIHVTTENMDKITHNVIGYLKGSIEPDRYVLYGNHRDAWVFGAIDPSSGTAVMLEVARVFGEAYKDGWRPRRTMVFCSWGAEEFGIMGSSEWVEEFQKALTFRSVAYINVDIAVRGNWTMRSLTKPNFHQVIFDAAQKTPDPYIKENSVYDTWFARTPHATEDRPKTGNIGSGSDYLQFIQLAGVSSLDISYTYDSNVGNLSSYPVYHSVYETFDLVKEQVDAEFKYHQAVARTTGEVARQLADSAILPMNCVDYAVRIIDLKKDFLIEYGELMGANGINTTHMDVVFQEFLDVATEFHKRVDDVDKTNLFEVRAINDQLMQLDRAFIDINGLPGSLQYRHVIFAPSSNNAYSGAAFPALTDSLFDIENDTDQEGRWKNVKREYSILLYHVGSASSTLRPSVPISGVTNLKPITEL